jgi:hypothetical protein
MAPDGALQETLMAKRVEATFFSVPLPRGKQKRQIAWFAGLDETPFQRDQEGIGNTDAHKSGGTDCISRLYDCDSFCRRSYFVAHFPSESQLLATIRRRLQSRDSASRENGSKMAADTRRSGENYLALENQVKQSGGKQLNRRIWIAA